MRQERKGESDLRAVMRDSDFILGEQGAIKDFEGAIRSVTLKGRVLKPGSGESRVLVA